MDPSQLIAVILAGGFGTRIQHLLTDVPKPMVPVLGKPFLEWVVRYLHKQGVRSILISTGYRSEIIARHFAAEPVPEMRVQCVAEEKPLGTAGGFLRAAHQVAEPPPAWLVLNGDSLAFADLAPALRQLEDQATEGVIYGREVPDTSRYGTLVVGKNAQLLKFGEKQPGRGLISAGIYLLRHSLLKEFPDKQPLSFETEVFPALTARETQLKVEAVNAPFLDIGTPESLRLAEPFIQDNLSRFSGV